MQFSMNLQPSIYDWGWNPNAPNVTELSSYMYFGALDPNLGEHIRDQSKNSLLLEANQNSYWTFNFGSYGFGSNSDPKLQQ